MVSRNLGIRDRCLEEGELEIPELLPVEDLGIQIDAERSEDLLDVADRQLGIPAIVQVHGQRPEAELLRHVRDIRAVHSAAHAQDTVVGFAPSARLYLLDHSRECPPTVLARPYQLPGQVLVGMAVNTDPVLFEADLGVAGVHDAVGADPVCAISVGRPDGSGCLL